MFRFKSKKTETLRTGFGLVKKIALTYIPVFKIPDSLAAQVIFSVRDLFRKPGCPERKLFLQRLGLRPAASEINSAAVPPA